MMSATTPPISAPTSMSPSVNRGVMTWSTIHPNTNDCATVPTAKIAAPHTAIVNVLGFSLT